MKLWGKTASYLLGEFSNLPSPTIDFSKQNEIIAITTKSERERERQQINNIGGDATRAQNEFSSVISFVW